MIEQSKIMTTPEVLALTRVSRTTLHVTLLKKTNFPKPFKVGLRANNWLRADVEAWLNDQAMEVAA